MGGPSRSGSGESPLSQSKHYSCEDETKGVPMTQKSETKKVRVDEKTLLVCVNKRLACGERGGASLADTLEKMAQDQPESGVKIRRVVCLGKCDNGPNVHRYRGPVYHRVADQSLLSIFEEAAVQD